MNKSLLRLFSLSLLLGATVVLASCHNDDGDEPEPPVPTAEPQGVMLNTTNFPDDNFRAYVASLTGVAEGELIPEEVLAQVTEINVRDKHIETLRGVEHFSELEELVCSFNNLTSFDLSQNLRLEELDCQENQLTSLDVSKNLNLKGLYCRFNELTSVDVSKNEALRELDCYGNNLTSLIVSPTGALTELVCATNQLQGTQMDALIASLPAVSAGRFVVINPSAPIEGNVCTATQVNAARAKGWKVLDTLENEYAGS